MKSLAEHLGIDLTQATPSPDAPDIDLETLSAREFARQVLGSYEYRMSLLHRITLGDLPPAVECLLYHHAFGKPVERVEVEDKTPVATDRAQLFERIAYLNSLVEELREDEAHKESHTDASTVH